MTCKKVGLVLKGKENSHAFYSGASRGTLFPKILIFNNIGDLGDGAQYLQPEIEPRIVLDRILSTSNRSPDVENLAFYLSEFRRLGDKFGENLVIQVFENALGADLIPPSPPPPPPVIQEQIQVGFDFEFRPTVDPIIPPAPPPPVAPVVSPPPPLPPQTQTMQELCANLLTLNEAAEIHQQLFNRSKEFGKYLLTIDMDKAREIINKGSSDNSVGSWVKI
jgi:hypothetical protein